MITSSLNDIALRHGADKASSHHNYCVNYSLYFERLRETPITLLEIGVQAGASIRTWLEYFPNANIIGNDINHEFQFEDPRYQFIQGPQEEVSTWNNLPTPLDIVIDDGCHYPKQQLASFGILWPKLRPGAYYCVEDTFTWWHPAFSQMPATLTLLDWLTGTLNKFGQEFYGNPTPNTLPVADSPIEFIHLYYGLMIIKKK